MSQIPEQGGSETVDSWRRDFPAGVAHNRDCYLTAKPTAILSDMGNRRRTSVDSDFLVLILGERCWTLADVRNAVFKTAGSGGVSRVSSYVAL